LEGSQVKDLLALADLMKLEMLDLNNTQVADIAPLVGLKKLRRLNLWRTRVSKEQVLSLKRALPDLQIHGPDGGGV
jgi:Leucine-rich repeat (LRR) protein